MWPWVIHSPAPRSEWGVREHFLEMAASWTSGRRGVADRPREQRSKQTGDPVRRELKRGKDKRGREVLGPPGCGRKGGGGCANGTSGNDASCQVEGWLSRRIGSVPIQGLAVSCGFPALSLHHAPHYPSSPLQGPPAAHLIPLSFCPKCASPLHTPGLLGRHTRNRQGPVQVTAAAPPSGPLRIYWGWWMGMWVRKEP